MLLRDLPVDALQAFAGFAASPAGMPLLSVEFRLLGGELAPGRGEGGAVADLDAGFVAFAGGMVATSEHAAAVDASLDALAELLRPWTAETTYLNFAERRVGPEVVFGESLSRLRRIKTAYDRQDRIRGNHPVEPHGMPEGA